MNRLLIVSPSLFYVIAAFILLSAVALPYKLYFMPLIHAIAYIRSINSPWFTGAMYLGSITSTMVFIASIKERRKDGITQTKPLRILMIILAIHP